MKKNSFISAVLIVFMMVSFCFEAPNIGVVSAQNGFEGTVVNSLNCHHGDCEDGHEEMCGYTEHGDCEDEHEEICGYTEHGDCEDEHEEICGCTEHEDCESGHEEMCGCTEHEDCECEDEACGCEYASGNDKENTISNLDINDIETAENTLFVGTSQEIKSGIEEYSTLSTVVLAATCSHTFNGSYTTTKEPTCTTTGKKEGRCTRCGAVVSTITIAALGHSYGSWTTTKAATCTTDGSKKRTCSRCKAVDTETIKATGHTFNGSYTTTKEPTCTTTGTKEGRCTKCGGVVSTASIAALGHSYGSWTTTKAATCTTDGSKKRTCSRCKAVDTETIKATGHTFNGSYTTTKEPTCTTTGTKEGRCTKCGGVVSTASIAALGHSYGSWTTTKAATCTTDGSQSRTCSRCKAVDTQTTKATGHTFNGSYTTTKEPTCTTTGTKEGKCTKCGQTVSTITIDALGHSYGSWKTLKEATCTEEGIREGTCSRCSARKTEKISPSVHSFNGSYTTVKEPTCTDEGRKEGRCTKCGAVVSTVAIPALGGTHQFNGSYTTVKEATCTQEGRKEGKCTRCGATVSTISIPKLEHPYNWKTIKEATCTEEGIREGTCSKCSARKTEKISPSVHSFNGSYTTVKEPTCTDEGRKEGHCTKCGAVVSTVAIPALGGSHQFNGSYATVKEATCTQEGRKEGKCTRCGATVSTISIPKLEHSYNWRTIKEETCTQEGIREGTCSKCSTRKTETISPKGHQFNGSFVTVKEPTCTDEGRKEGRCTRCGEVVTTASIPALGGAHQFNGSYATVKEPTCTEKGLAEGRCNRCRAVVSTREIPELGGVHQFNGSYATVKEATCTEDGLKEGRCSRCKAVVSKITIPAKHTYSQISTRPSTVTLGGGNATETPIYVNAICSRCKKTIDVTSEAKFSSSNSNLASVVNRYIKSGTQFGTATITANYGGMKAVCSVEVKPAGGAKLRALRITPKEDTIAEFNKWGSEVKVMAVYDNGEVDITDYVEFTSGDKSIAYVDKVGNKKYIKSGIKKGTTLITASYEGKKDTCTVKVDMAYEVETKPFKIGNSTGFTIPEDLPVIGGSEIEFDLDFIPATLSFGKEEFKVAIGMNDVNSVGEKWDEFKKTFDSAKKSMASTKALRDKMKKLGTKTGKLGIEKGWEPDLDAFGYIEGVIIDGIPIVTSGSIALIAEAKYTNQTQYLIGPVPVYFEIGGGVKLEYINDIFRFNLQTGEAVLNSQLKITPSFELGGGVGVAKVLTVGGSGEAELEFLIIGKEDYLKVTLTGSLKLKATALFFSAEKEIAKGTWSLYESHPRNKSLMMASPYADAKLDMYNIDEYKMMSRDYIDRPSVWMGNQRLMRAMATEYTNKEMKVLGTNIYPDAQPQLVDYEDKQVLVWISDNPNRTSANRTMLVYSVYDKNSGMWSEPVAVDDDGTADFYPQLAQEGSDIYVVWQNCNKTFTEDVTLEEVAGSGEIAVSKFDGETDSFGAVVQLTENDVVDMLPQITVSGGSAYIAWISNNKNDIFGVDGENSIYYCELKGDEWSSPEILSEGLNAVLSLSAGVIEDSFAVGYALDGDDVLETIDDTEIYVVKPGSKDIRLTNNDTVDSAPVFSSFNGTGALYWYNEGNILFVTQLDAEPDRVFSGAKPGLKDDFKVVEGSKNETAIIWANTTRESSAIYTAIYDADSATWSDAVKLSDVAGEIQSPDGVFDDNGNISIAFSRLTQLEDGNEQADLCIIKVVPSYNLSVDGISFDHNKVIPGTQLAIDVEVTNNGEIGVEELVVDILDGDEIINSEAIGVSLKPGETKTATALMNLPDTITKKTYSVRVSTVEGEEYNTNDNIKQFTIGYTDITVQLERYSEGDIEYVTANVINLSHMPSGATLKVTKGSEEGEVIDTKIIKSTDDIVKYEYQFDKKVLCADKESEVLYFTVVADEEEIYTSDNVKFIVLSNEQSSNETSISGYISVDFDYPSKSESKIKSGFNVKIAGTELSAKTDEKGYFEISGIPDDMKEFTLEISKPSYLKRYVTVNGTGELVVSTEDNPIILWAGDLEYKGAQDNAINMVDVMQIAKTYDTVIGDEGYIADYDLNDDGAINFKEVFIIFRHFNTISSDY